LINDKTFPIIGSSSWPRLTFSYDPEEDVFIFTPLDSEGNEWEEKSIIVEASTAVITLETLDEAISDLFKTRRILNKAREKGVDCERVIDRLEAGFEAEAVNDFIKEGGKF
jgi:hypothetical protein